ncbi:MAG: thioredoxin family protein [Bacteroidota bacterium]
MPVITVNDTELRHLIYSKENAAVKYTSPTCEICKKLAPTYEEISNDPNYKSIFFVKIDANENPVAKEFLDERAMPLLVTYHKGVVMEASPAATEEDILRMLKKLPAKK